jgi:hypothetical protein
MFGPVELSLNWNEVVKLPKGGRLNQSTTGGGGVVQGLPHRPWLLAVAHEESGPVHVIYEDLVLSFPESIPAFVVNIDGIAHVGDDHVKDRNLRGGRIGEEEDPHEGNSGYHDPHEEQGPDNL